MTAEPAPSSTARLAEVLALPSATVDRALAEAGVDAGYLVRALVEGDAQGAIGATARRLNVPKRALVAALAKLRGAELVAGEDPELQVEAADRVGALIDAALAQVAPPDEIPVRLQVASREGRDPATLARALAAAEAARHAQPERDVRVLVRPPQAAPAKEDPLAKVLTGNLDRVLGRAAWVALGLGLVLAAFGVLGFVALQIFQVAVWYLAAALFVGLGIVLVATGWRLHRLRKRQAR